MPYAVISEWAGGGGDTRNYDEISRRLNVEEDPPAGLVVHTAGATPEGGFRISDVWETREAYEVFASERLAPIQREVISALPPERQAEAGPPVTTVYELHDLIVPAPAALGR